MGTILKYSLSERLKEYSKSLGFKILCVCLSAILIVTVVMNTYPLIISQDLIINAKQDKLITRANYISSALSNAGQINEITVLSGMKVHDVQEGERIVVCDSAGRAVFDSSEHGNTVGKYVILPEVMSALSGSENFHSAFLEHSFQSKVSVPIIASEGIVGAVYLYETDSAQAGILLGMRHQLQWFSFVIALLLVIFVLLFSGKLIRRLRTLLEGIRKMRNGAYGSTVAPKGHDELAVIFDEFNNLSERLQATEELRRTFVSDASHELRTPLSSIRLLTDSILQTPDIDIETVKDFLKDIGEEIDRLTRIAEKLLVLTRLDGAKNLELSEVDFSKVVSMALDTLEPIAEEGKITIRRDLSDNMRIMADSDGVHQIVFNLVENAIKYNKPEGYVHVILFERDGVCCLIVDDTGIGIPEEDYDKIFERFYRVDKARSRSGKGGTGLGLAIVRRNIENYNGNVKIERSAAGGTRFTVEFPAVNSVEGTV